MSVNIKYTPVSSEDKWKTIKNGDFVILQGDEQNPIPLGLYRIFTIASTEETGWFVVPMFDLPLPPNMFPYALNDPFPTIQHIITKVHIEAEHE